MVTNYRYNTLNQVAAQETPDGGASNFWYDRLGRLAVSQNARQNQGISIVIPNMTQSAGLHKWVS
ncbi:hypothetical protein ACQ86N_41165 [Puia sp. P3]|uniref:hypothetical protein n=1 Tax=Puia sp. P3 TaxID=3423952 RepID=UPI003D66689A